MEDSLKKELKEVIRATIVKLSGDAERLEKITAPISPSNAIGRLSRLEAMNEKAVNEASLRHVRERLLLLERSLKEIDEDEDFGICQNCDEPIPFGRLKVLPEAKVCVQCINEAAE